MEYLFQQQQKKHDTLSHVMFFAWILFFRVVWLFKLDFLTLALVSLYLCPPTSLCDWILVPIKSTSSVCFPTKHVSSVSCAVLVSHIFNQSIEDYILWSTLRINQHSLLLSPSSNIRTLSRFAFSLCPGPQSLFWKWDFSAHILLY